MIKKRKLESFWKKASPKRRLKEKALFNIFILICSIFYFSLSFQDVDAQSNQQACCEVTKSGDYCVYTNRNQCDASKGSVSNSYCEDSKYCALGTCIYDKEGECFSNTYKSACEKNNGVWSTEKIENILQCQKGCCNIGGQYQFIGEKECKVKLNTIYGNNYQLADRFTVAETEQACLQLSLQDKEGCCVDNNICKYGIKSECTGDFNLNSKCSSLNECKNCVNHSYKDCKDGSVYWFDSCGNPEDISEECDYSKGNLCAKEKDKVYCKSLDCSTTTKFEGWDYTGGARKHGESWCVYESPTGNFLDKPGSRHYQYNCLFGNEVAQDCGDYRTQVCVQANFNNSGFSQASCVNNNRYNSPVTTNVSSVSTGFNFWDSKNALDYKNKCNKGTTRCTVYYVKQNNVHQWGCEGNCFCEDPEFIDLANNYCKSFGDCGFDYNLLDKPGSGGLNVYWTGDDTEGNIISFTESYLKSLNKLGIYDGMSFLSSETEKIIAGGTDVEATDIAWDVLIYGEIGFIVLGIASTFFFTSVLTSVGALFSWAALGNILSLGAASTELSVTLAKFGSITTSLSATVIFAIVAVILQATIISFTLAYSGGETKERTLNIECKPWQAPLGGKDCDKCNEGPNKDCTEYKCRSLGTTCKLVNNDKTDDPQKLKCVNANPNDIIAPKLSPLVGEGYNFIPEKLGYRIKELVKPLEQFTFGVITDEESTCVYDFKIRPSNDFEEMKDFGDGLYGKEHKVSLILEGNKDFKYFVKCRDASGNIGPDYQITFKTKNEPDNEAPRIIQTSVKNNAAIQNKIESIPLTLELNEPANCKFDVKDNKKFEDMSGISVCNDKFSEIPVKYTCDAALTNLKKGINTFFFRCRDLTGHTTSPIPFSVIRSEPLNITDVSPKDSLNNGDIILSATTRGGSEQGEASCRYNTKDLSYSEMTEKSEFKITNSIIHSQSQKLRPGTYTYFVRCMDSAGNEDKAKINFRILGNVNSGSILNVYKDSLNINVILDVDSFCEYKDKLFSFGFGEKMDGDNTTIHSAPLKFNQYYIQCKDNNGKVSGLKVNI